MLTDMLLAACELRSDLHILLLIIILCNMSHVSASSPDMVFAPAYFIFSAVAVFERHPFVIGTSYIDHGVSTVNF